RVADDGASNGDALLLSARKLLGEMVGAVFQADELQRGHHVITALLRVELGQQQRKFHVLKGGEYRDQVERLENVADVRIAPVGRLFVIEPENVLASTSSSPLVGRSMAAIMFSKVVFPEPAGPMSARIPPPEFSMGASLRASSWRASRLTTLVTFRAWTTVF